MQVWFSKFIRGRVFSVLFCILGFGLTIYLSSRLGILIEGFAGLDLQLAIFLILTVFCTYMLIYVNIHRENKKTQKLFNLCGIIFSFFPSAVIWFFLFDPDKIPLRSLRWAAIPHSTAVGCCYVCLWICPCQKDLCERVFDTHCCQQQAPKI